MINKQFCQLHKQKNVFLTKFIYNVSNISLAEKKISTRKKLVPFSEMCVNLLLEQKIQIEKAHPIINLFI